ncbi:MAG: ATP-dependent DNA helicase RecG [Verrucomicrobia bacterium]|nr:ATP-dependent DNA helicase RecG [Verrucomicrobiota bacterium]
MPDTPTSPLAQPLRQLRGVGPERAAQLAKLGLLTVGDLLLHRPRRYEDRRHFLKISELQLGEAATTRGTVVAHGVKRYSKSRKSVYELILEDGSARLHCRWWNLPWMENYFAVGDEVFVHGRPLTLKPRTIDHPETEVIEASDEGSLHLNRIAPVYPLTEGLPQRWLRSLVWRVLEQFENQIKEPLFSVESKAAGRSGADSLSPSEGERARVRGGGRDYFHASLGGPCAPSPRPSPPSDGGEGVAFPMRDLPSRANAVHMIHFPEEMADVETARQRLALDEFIELQLAIQQRRRRLVANARGLRCAGDNRLIKPFLARLGFTLTGAQTNVLREIRRDLGGGPPMRRLLQGDVGSGKTAVAACSALLALESGFNVALMAPTEILAEQHFRTFEKWFAPLGIAVELRTGSRKTVESRGSRDEGPGQPSTLDARPSTLFIGTHALLESAFAPDHLGLVIIDEQHKFGVAQREQLVRKGRYPHLLVMTATPIPRTLGLTLYGDLDVSVIDELPGGRGRIRTFVRGVERLPKVWPFLREKLAEGRQAYIVYPRVEDADERAGLKAVLKEFEKIATELAPFKIELLHGRLKADEKERVMAAFRTNEIQVLVASTVIEVGLDVPNATVMLIENAEQFGLAQLHQLRGRIGRGAHESHCILVADLKTEGAAQRLKVMEETTDGFRIAEEDLRLRGPGELLGREQSGLPPFRFGDLARDLPLVQRAKELAAQFLATDGTRNKHG